MDREFLLETIEELYEILGEYEELTEGRARKHKRVPASDNPVVRTSKSGLPWGLGKKSTGKSGKKGAFKVTGETDAFKKRFGQSEVEGMWIYRPDRGPIFIEKGKFNAPAKSDKQRNDGKPRPKHWSYDSWKADEWEGKKKHAPSSSEKAYNKARYAAKKQAASDAAASLEKAAKKTKRAAKKAGETAAAPKKKKKSGRRG